MPQEPGVKSAQDAFLESYYANMLPILERVLDEMVGPDQFLTLDNLELDLGKVGLDFEAKELTFKLETVLRESLTEAIEDQRVQEGSLADPNEAQGSESEVLFYFLETGRIPTWLEGSKFVPAALLAKLLSAPPAGFIAEFTRVLSIRAVQRRLAWGFSVEMKRQVLEALLPNLTTPIQSQIADLQQLHATKALLPISESVFELHVWESVLGVIPSVAQSNISEQQVFLRVLERLLPSSVFSGPAATWLLGESLAMHGESNVSKPVASAIQYLLERHASALERPIWQQEHLASSDPKAGIREGEQEELQNGKRGKDKQEIELAEGELAASSSIENKVDPEQVGGLKAEESDPLTSEKQDAKFEKEHFAELETDSQGEKVEGNASAGGNDLGPSDVDDLHPDNKLVNPEETDENLSREVLDKKSNLDPKTSVIPDEELTKDAPINPVEEVRSMSLEEQKQLSLEAESGLEGESEEFLHVEEDDLQEGSIDSQKTIQNEDRAQIPETESVQKESLTEEEKHKNPAPEDKLGKEATSFSEDEIDTASDEFISENKGLTKNLGDDESKASTLHKKQSPQSQSEEDVDVEKTDSESSKKVEDAPLDDLTAREGEKEKLASNSFLSPELEKVNASDDRKETVIDREGEIGSEEVKSEEELQNIAIEKTHTELLEDQEEKLDAQKETVEPITAKDQSGNKNLASKTQSEEASEEPKEEILEETAEDASKENPESIELEKHSPQDPDSTETPEAPPKK